MTWIVRSGEVDMPRELVDDGPADVLKISVRQALEAAGMTERDEYYVRIRVIELLSDPGLE